MCTLGFVTTVSDTSLFVFRHGTELAYLLLYVDYIVLTASSDRLLRTIIDQLHSVFAMKDLGPLHFFLGIQVRRTRHGFFLHQGQYAEELLERAGMTNCKPTPTPVDTKPKVSSLSSALATDGAHYRSIAGALQYLTLTYPDIAYAVQQLCLHMHAPCAAHWALAKRVLPYVHRMTHHGINITPSSSSALVAYSDADWAGCPDTRRSTSGYCVYLGRSLISWSLKGQPTVSRSSAEAEYRAVANATAKCSWLHNLLRELHISIDKATMVLL